MAENIILFYVASAAGGFIFQTILPGYIRMIVIYPLAFVLGLTTMVFSNFLILAFAIGMILRAVAGGYWFCVTLETIMLIAGIAVSYML